ncbi:MAG: hypothetical protein N3D72_03530 [Candidatus Methanomethyliaceae archaeon]|nr:hypothetical protein [Candidatus Methanomethyliaceae archaeon]
MKGKRLCEATCPYFRCGQRALFIKKGNPQAFCNWVGDICVAAKCKYALCEKRALLVDGSCGLEDREVQRKLRSIEEEAELEEAALKSAQMKLMKKTGKFFIE